MVTPDEANDPMFDCPGYEQWETACDTWLRENFADRDTQEATWRPATPIRDGVCRTIVARYKEAGWNIVWDGDVNNPYFKFKRPRPARPRHWYLLWLG